MEARCSPMNPAPPVIRTVSGKSRKACRLICSRPYCGRLANLHNKRHRRSTDCMVLHRLDQGVLRQPFLECSCLSTVQMTLERKPVIEDHDRSVLNVIINEFQHRHRRFVQVAINPYDRGLLYWQFPFEFFVQSLAISTGNTFDPSEIDSPSADIFFVAVEVTGKVSFIIPAGFIRI